MGVGGSACCHNKADKALEASGEEHPITLESVFGQSKHFLEPAAMPINFADASDRHDDGFKKESVLATPDLHRSNGHAATAENGVAEIDPMHAQRPIDLEESKAAAEENCDSTTAPTETEDNSDSKVFSSHDSQANDSQASTERPLTSNDETEDSVERKPFNPRAVAKGKRRAKVKAKPKPRRETPAVEDTEQNPETEPPSRPSRQSGRHSQKFKAAMEQEETRFDFFLGREVTFKDMCEQIITTWRFTNATEDELTAHWDDLLTENATNRFNCDLKCQCARADPICPSGHPLVPKIYLEHICDMCNKYGTAYRCSSNCNFDLCEKCFKGLQDLATQAYGETPLCDKGHPLEPQKMENLCDLCDSKGTSFRCSKGCNYDFCEHCYTSVKSLGVRIATAQREEQERLEAEEAERQAMIISQTTMNRTYGGRISKVLILALRRQSLWKILSLLSSLRPWKKIAQSKNAGALTNGSGTE